MSGQVQPGTFLATGVLLAASAVIGWGLGDALLSDIRADLNADRGVTASPPIVVTAPTDPYMVTVTACDDITGVYPCAAVRGTGWVLLWPTGRTERITPCPTEDGGPVLPCIHTDPVPGGFLLYTDHLDIWR